MNGKPCSLCKERESLSYNSYCGECMGAYAREWSALNPEKARAKAKRSYWAAHEHNLARSRLYYAEHRDDWYARYGAVSRAYYADNRERLRADGRQRYKERIEECRQWARDYWATHREESRAKSRAWRLANPERRRELARQYTQRRRLRLAGVTGRVTNIEMRAICERDGWVCQLCGKRVSKSKRAPHPLSRSLDHIEPVSCGGQHVLWNVQLAHLICNARRGAGRTPAQTLLAI